MTVREFTAIYKRRGKQYIAWVEELPGVNTQGKTKREAEENLKEAVLLILETNRKLALRDKGHLVRRTLKVGVPTSR